MQRVVKRYDITVLCGHRDQQDQDDAHTSGHSKVKWPSSKHNAVPSLAVDVAPYPLNWKDTAAFEAMGQVVLDEWLKMDAEDTSSWQLVWGKTFSGLVDYPHFELRRR